MKRFVKLLWSVYWPTAISGQAVSKEVGERGENWNLKVGGGDYVSFRQAHFDCGTTVSENTEYPTQSRLRVCYLCNCRLHFI
jgi:hypothetical protein